MDPELISQLANDYRLQIANDYRGIWKPGLTVWFTGLPCSGKTTIGRVVAAELNALGLAVELLDADDLRLTLCHDLGFSKADREENLRRIAFVSGSLARHGVIVLVSAIAPYQEIRADMREELGRFVEVYVNASLETCIRRDVKGMYREALKGKREHMTGIDSPYEPPESPEVVCRTDYETIEESAAKVIAFLRESYCGIFPAVEVLNDGAGI